jgi:hypothetical protein
MAANSYSGYLITNRRLLNDSTNKIKVLVESCPAMGEAPVFGWKERDVRRKFMLLLLVLVT